MPPALGSAPRGPRTGRTGARSPRSRGAGPVSPQPPRWPSGQAKNSARQLPRARGAATSPPGHLTSARSLRGSCSVSRSSLRAAAAPTLERREPADVAFQGFRPNATPLSQSQRGRVPWPRPCLQARPLRRSRAARARETADAVWSGLSGCLD
jgi:hypothetical protein